MKRIKLNKYFYLDEFIDPRTYFNCKGNGIDEIDNRLFDVALLLRRKYGYQIRINNWWHYYEKLRKRYSLDYTIRLIEQSDYSKWSGYRPPTCPIGARYSAHKKGLAIDPKGNEHILKQIVKDNAKEFYDLGVRRIEDIKLTPGWLHIDLEKRNMVENAIRIIDRRKQVGIIRF